ncbi:MAG: ATP-binding cassette domain-containing protein [bacterium]|jgi:ATPase subunit of ABC transporter with duplicated ATPase domains|nr:ATP-binding cassette domain-containing protein [bacterium]
MRQAKAIEKRIELSIEREEAKKPVIEKVRKVILNSISLKNKTVLEVKNLGKMYGDTIVFSGLSFQVPNGARLAVRGKNGCGKTTLLEILTARLKASIGSFRWAAQADIGYFSQEQET